jgi:hypothetical protein
MGERGTVALLDAGGTVVSVAPFSRVGTVRLPVPAAYRTLPLTAQITVHRGATKAVSGVALLPNAFMPAVASTAAPSPVRELAAGGAAPKDSVSAGAAASIVAVAGRAVAGHTLNLRVAAQRAPVRIELQDETGSTISETQLAAGATRAALPLPPATGAVTYLIAMHYTRDGSEETVIRTIVATPR